VRDFLGCIFWGWHRDALGRNMVSALFFALNQRQAKATSQIEFLNLPSRSTKQNDWDEGNLGAYFFFAATWARRRSSCSLSSGVNSAPKSSASNT
jgi:hypothetical protein